MFKLFNEIINSVKLIGDIYILRTMRCALIATYAMAGLAKFRHTAVETYKKCLPGFAVILRLLALGYIALVDTLVIM